MLYNPLYLMGNIEFILKCMISVWVVLSSASMVTKEIQGGE